MIYAAVVINGRVTAIHEVESGKHTDGSPVNIVEYLSDMRDILEVKKTPIPYGVKRGNPPNSGKVGIVGDSYRFGAADMSHAAYVAEYILRNKDK